MLSTQAHAQLHAVEMPLEDGHLSPTQDLDNIVYNGSRSGVRLLWLASSGISTACS